MSLRFSLQGRKLLVMAAAWAAVAVSAGIPGTTLAVEATGVLKRASAVMGDPKSLKYVAEGNGYTLGQAFVPGAPWPRINVRNYSGQSVNSCKPVVNNWVKVDTSCHA